MQALHANVSAQKLLRALLNGESPTSSAQAQEYGIWQESIQALLNAQRQSGTAGVRQVFNALVQQKPALGKLVASDLAPPQTLWTAAELLATEFPPLKWIVPDILPEGLAILAGRPKIGKSWLALDIAQAAGGGGQALGRNVAPAKVLYIVLEDGPRRLHDRLRSLHAAPPTNLTFALDWPKLDRGGLSALQTAVAQSGYNLVIIDTLSRALQTSDQNNSTEMTSTLGGLHQLTILHGISLVLIDHHNKLADLSGDPIQALYGSVAKAGVSDVILGLFREPQKSEARLKVSGRDVEALDLALTWNDASATWALAGDAEAVRRKTNKDLVLEAIGALEALGQLPCTKTIAGYLEMNDGNVNRLLSALLTDGRIVKEEKVGRLQPYRLRGIVEG